jgi:hypothetical protein
MSDLMQKLAQSNARALMTNDIKASKQSFSNNMMEDYEMPNAKYNIPQEFLQENSPSSHTPYLSSLPVENTKPVGVPTVEAIKNSRLPDEIKKLMMEHPIAQPQQVAPTLSNDLIERASRLMGNQPKNTPITETTKKQSSNAGIDYKLIQKMINEAVKNALKENGLIAESSEKSNETFSFKVGKHVFEGKVTKIKKLS